MNRFFTTLAVAVPILLALDFTFIYFILENYSKMVVAVQGSPLRFKFGSGLLCYAFIIASLYYFILKDRRSTLDAFLLGFFIYGILETTNCAILSKWDPTIATIDALWGGALYAGTTYLTYYFTKNR